MSSTRLLVLGVVRIFQPIHGYDVRRELLQWRAEEWANVAPGSIYNALKSMTRDGLLEMVGTSQVGARPERTSYRLTVDGQAEYDRLVRDAWWTVRHPIDTLLPAVSLMTTMPRVEMIAALHSRIDTVKHMQAQSQYAIDNWKASDEKPSHVQEMFRLMSARLGAEIEWAKQLIERLSDGEHQAADDSAPATGRSKPSARVAALAKAKNKQARKKPGKPPQRKPRSR